MDYFIGIQLFSRELPLRGVETKKEEKKKKNTVSSFPSDFKNLLEIIMQEKGKKITKILTLQRVSQ